MPTTICQRCQTPNELNATVCINCGARLCPHCHLVIDSPNASVCPKCGKKDHTFRPGKYSGSTFIPPSVSPTVSPSFSYCPNCGSKIEPGVKKCPYCGRLGTLVFQSPQQGYGVMNPAQGDTQIHYASPEPEPGATQTQKVCQKCGMPFPPGSSQCPRHGKYGGGGVLKESTIKLEGPNLWAKIEEKRAASAASEQDRMQPLRSTPPQDIYPQMKAAPAAHAENYPPVEALEQRICPVCGAAVPDRSKVCPNCGNNRLPTQKSKPFMKAEDYYKAHAPSEQPYSGYPPSPEYGQAQGYAPAPGYGQPQGYQQGQDMYYGQPAVQPYEATYPVASPSFIEDLSEDRRQKRQKKEKPPKESRMREGRPVERKSPLPMLLALVALGITIVIAAVLILDQLKTPAVVIPPSSLNPGTTTTAPASDIPNISDVNFSDITRNSAVVTWKTDRNANSIVIYCLEGGAQCENTKDESMVTDHQITLTGLEPGASYHITVKSRAGSSNDSPEASVEVPTPLRLQEAVNDTTPPKISEIETTNWTGNSIKITWKTDEGATGLVSYGTSSSYGKNQEEQTDANLPKYHEVTLYELSPQTTYHYKIISRDAAGNETSKDDTFVTPPPIGSAIGNCAPDFTLTSTEGKSVTLSDLKGKKVMINFWSLNCPYCDLEMPAIQEFHDKYPDVPVLSICGPQNGSVNKYYVGSMVQEKNFTFTVLIDEPGQVGNLYNINEGVPVTYFIDAAGIIRDIKDGAFMNGLSEIENKYNSY